MIAQRWSGRATDVGPGDAPFLCYDGDPPTLEGGWLVGEAEAPRRAAGYLALLRDNERFRRLYGARAISLLGDWFNTLAVLALLRAIGGEDARSYGWVLILKTLPALFVAPLAGVLADRLSRKALLIAMDLVRALAVGLMLLLFAPAAWGGPTPGPWALYVLVVAQTAAFAVAEPARTALVPDVVAPVDLVTAGALNAVTWSAAFTVGTALGGLLTSALGWRAALIVDIATYLVSAAVLYGLRAPPRHTPVPAGGLSELREGARYLIQRPRVWSLTLAKAGWAAAGGGITLVLTVLGERVYRLDGDPILAVTVLYMARGIGTGLGPVVARRLCGADPERGERAIGWAYLWGAGFYLAIGGAGGLPLAAALVLLAHLGGSTVWVFSTVRLQALVPTEVRGRVLAAEQATWTLATAASTWACGLAIDAGWLPLPGGASLLGLLLLLPAGLWALRQRALRRWAVSTA